VFRPRGRLARLSLPKKNRTGQTKKPQGEMPPQIELAPDGDIGGGEISSGKKFREALSKANAGVVAAVLRETDSLDRRAVDALVYLLDVTAKDYGGWEDLCPHKLIFLNDAARRRTSRSIGCGTPKSRLLWNTRPRNRERLLCLTSARKSDWGAAPSSPRWPASVRPSASEQLANSLDSSANSFDSYSTALTAQT